LRGVRQGQGDVGRCSAPARALYITCRIAPVRKACEVCPMIHQALALRVYQNRHPVLMSPTSLIVPRRISLSGLDGQSSAAVG
jgi:hypothetical protein